MTEINVYSKPSCVQCDATKTKLDKLGLEYNLIDVTENDDALAHIVALGFSQAPVVEVVGVPDMIWSGYSPDRLNALAQMTFPVVDPDNTPLVGA